MLTENGHETREDSELEKHSQLVQQASEALLAGEIVAIPTDTVYGLAAAIDCPAAISHLYAVKDRPAEKAIPVLLSDAHQVNQVAAGMSATAYRLASFFWPGALTLVLPALPHLPSPLTSTAENGVRTVAIRVPDNFLARAIIAAVGGALAVTSANRSGENPALEARDVSSIDAFPPILVIDGGKVTGGVPSTVILATGETPVILREGAISATTIAQVLGNDIASARGAASAQYDRAMSGQHRASSATDTTG